MKFFKLREATKEMMTLTDKDDPVFDGLRGISILMIILFHSFFGVFWVLKDKEKIMEFLNHQVPPVLSFLLTTEKAVDLFFIISGFLLTYSLLHQLQTKKMIQLLSFYVKRFYRIYPLFLIAIIVYYPINFSRSTKNLLYNLFFIDNFYAKSIIPVGWSLSIEMQFYILLPFLILLMHKWKKFGFWLLSALFLGSFAVRYLVCVIYPEIASTPFYAFHTGGPAPGVFLDNMYYPTHTRFGPLLIGVALAWIQVSVHADGLRNFVRKVPSAVYFILALLCIVGMAYFPPYRPASVFYQPFNEQWNLWLHVIHRNVYALGWFFLLLMIYHKKSLLTDCCRRFLSFRVWRPYSQAVFGIYLFHFPMVAISGIVVLGTTNVRAVETVSLLQTFVIFGVASLMSLALGIFLYAYVEKPWIEKGRKLAKKFSESYSLK